MIAFRNCSFDLMSIAAYRRSSFSLWLFWFVLVDFGVYLFGVECNQLTQQLILVIWHLKVCDLSYSYLPVASYSYKWLELWFGNLDFSTVWIDHIISNAITHWVEAIIVFFVFICRWFVASLFTSFVVLFFAYLHSSNKDINFIPQLLFNSYSFSSASYSFKTLQ